MLTANTAVDCEPLNSFGNATHQVDCNTDIGPVFRIYGTLMTPAPNRIGIKRMLCLVLSAASLLSLAGCAGLEIANAAVQTGSSAVSDLIPAQRMTVVSNNLESATPATYKPYVYRAGQDCISSAFVVPYDRTWPEEIREGDSGQVRLLPPEPGKIAGYVAVVYKKECPGTAPDPLLRAGRQVTVTGTGTIFTRAFSSDNTTYFMSSWDHAIDSRDMLDDKAKPLWWPQVAARLVRLAATDSAIKQMFVTNEVLFQKAAPEQTQRLRVLAQ